jgi:hypothetical protein
MGRDRSVVLEGLPRQALTSVERRRALVRKSRFFDDKRRTWVKLIAMRWLFALVLLCGCDQLFGVLRVNTASPVDASSDGRGEDALATDAADAAVDALALGPWAAPTMVPGNLLETGDDPSFTENGLQLFYGLNQDIKVRSRASTMDSWGAPTVSNASAPGADDAAPKVSADGLRLYFASKRANPVLVLFVARRNAPTDAWMTPTAITELAGTVDTVGPTVTADETVIVFARSGDLHIATRASASVSWGPPAPLDELNTMATDGAPMVSPDGLTLYFTSNRAGDTDIYVASRVSRAQRFDPPLRIGELASTNAEQDPWVSSDQRRIYFMRSGQLFTSTR